MSDSSEAYQEKVQKQIAKYEKYWIRDTAGVDDVLDTLKQIGKADAEGLFDRAEAKAFRKAIAGHLDDTGKIGKVWAKTRACRRMLMKIAAFAPEVLGIVAFVCNFAEQAEGKEFWGLRDEFNQCLAEKGRNGYVSRQSFDDAVFALEAYLSKINVDDGGRYLLFEGLLLLGSQK